MYMFRKDNDFIPKTYSIKGFRKRKTMNIGKVVAGFSVTMVVMALLIVVLLSVFHLI